MEKNLWKKDEHEVNNDELVAYTIAKIRPLEWVRITMYSLEDIYKQSPVFCWRFNDPDEEVYSQLMKCIDEFIGNMPWVMYKGGGANNQSGRNYTIEPRVFYDLRQTSGNDKLIKVLEHQYHEECKKAVDDIEPLCKYIERTFDLANKRPHLPIPPFRKQMLLQT